MPFALIAVRKQKRIFGVWFLFWITNFQFSYFVKKCFYNEECWIFKCLSISKIDVNEMWRWIKYIWRLNRYRHVRHWNETLQATASRVTVKEKAGGGRRHRCRLAARHPTLPGRNDDIHSLHNTLNAGTSVRHKFHFCIALTRKRREGINYMFAMSVHCLKTNIFSTLSCLFLALISIAVLWQFCIGKQQTNQLRF